MTESDCSSPSPEKGDDTRSSYRKSNKPLMEKRRRARINTCLTELKTLVLQAMKKDNAQYSKLEKADILELTVKHLRLIQRHQITAAIDSNSNVIHKYRAGFNECANEVMRYLATVPGVQDEVRGRVLGHLANCMQTVNTGQSSNRQLPVTSTLLHQGHVQHSALVSENGTAFQPIIRDQTCSLSDNISCLASTPLQLVQTSGQSPQVTFVLSSPPRVQAVPLYASPHSSVVVETVVKEEVPSRPVCFDSFGDIKHSAFRDVIHGHKPQTKSLGTQPQIVDINENEESMWRPW